MACGKDGQLRKYPISLVSVASALGKFFQQKPFAPLQIRLRHILPKSNAPEGERRPAELDATLFIPQIHRISARLRQRVMAGQKEIWLRRGNLSLGAALAIRRGESIIKRAGFWQILPQKANAFVGKQHGIRREKLWKARSTAWRRESSSGASASCTLHGALSKSCNVFRQCRCTFISTIFTAFQPSFSDTFKTSSEVTRPYARMAKNDATVDPQAQGTAKFDVQRIRPCALHAQRCESQRRHQRGVRAKARPCELLIRRIGRKQPPGLFFAP